MRRDIIKRKMFTDAEIILIKDKFKTARNEKGNPQADNIETESEDGEIWDLIVQVKLFF